jgi:hypothetical protein
MEQGHRARGGVSRQEVEITWRRNLAGEASPRSGRFLALGALKGRKPQEREWQVITSRGRV